MGGRFKKLPPKRIFFCSDDIVRHDPTWPPISIKLPLDIPKFEGKTREDPRDDGTTFYLWCSSNSLNDDSIRLQIFQRNLTSVVTKWYIELPSATYDSFLDLATIFLNHFRLHVSYDVVTNILSTFMQNKATHIYDHIQE